jgi:hypothetical protein
LGNKKQIPTRTHLPPQPPIIWDYLMELKIEFLLKMRSKKLLILKMQLKISPNINHSPWLRVGLMLLIALHQEKVLKQSMILKLIIKYSKKGLPMKIIIILLLNLKTPRERAKCRLSSQKTVSRTDFPQFQKKIQKIQMIIISTIALRKKSNTLKNNSASA